MKSPTEDKEGLRFSVNSEAKNIMRKNENT